MAALTNVAGRFGMSPKELKRFIKFAVVGVIGAIVDFGIFNLMRLLLLSVVQTDQGQSWAVTAASTISFITAICSNFLWNRYWTYPDSRTKSLRRQFTQFALVNFAGIIIRAPLVWLTHDLFTRLLQGTMPSLGAETAVVLGDNMAVMLAVGVVMFWNFFINRYWTYNDVD